MAWPDKSYVTDRVTPSPESESVISDGCWESARSSWIYMEMEPRSEGCWRPSCGDDDDEEKEEDGDNVTLSCGSGGSGSGKPGLEFVEGITGVSREDNGVIEEENEGDDDEEEDDEEDEGDYAVIANDDDGDDVTIIPGSPFCLKLENDNFILRREPSVVVSNRLTLSPVGPRTDDRRIARRSVSLDAYPAFNLNKSMSIKQSETISFSPILDRPRELPGLRIQPPVPQRLPHRSSITYPPASSFNIQPIHPSSHQEFETDCHSIASACTVATTSTTTSCNSLYRIPAKMRKLSSTSSSKSAKTPDSLAKSHLAFYTSSTTVPKLLQDVMSCLWSDNPDRDPFNTFAVSELELTSAIAHLEHQLSSSTRSSSKGIKTRPPLFTSFSAPAPVSYTSASTSPVTPSFPYPPLPPPPSCPLPELPSPDGLPLESHGNVKPNGVHGSPVEDQLPYRVQFIMESYCNIFMMRKQDLRELKLLQKQENKQITDLAYKNHVALETKEKKFEADIANLKKQFDQDLDAMLKQQKQIIEKAEQTQNNDTKNASKKMKAEQERELKNFRENQKQEMKLLKQELDLLPRDNKKEKAQKLREAKQIDLEQKERMFLEKQTERMETHISQLADQHRQKIALLERQCLQQKQQTYRNREAGLWEMEKTQLHERHQLGKTQLKDMFFVKRHQMLIRHQKEMDNLKRYNHMKEEEMSNRHTMEKRRLPKILKSEAKTRAQMFKQSLRLSSIGTPDDDKAKIKQFEESEKKRMKSEQMRQEEKHRRQAKALMDKNEAAVKELENLQGEKRKMLMEQETQKIKELDEHFEQDMKEWRALLSPRKQTLEEQFRSEMEEQQSFYGDVIQGDLASASMQNYRSGATSVRSKISKDGTLNSRHSTVI